MNEESENHVLLCFSLHEAFLENGAELPSITYSSTLDDSTIDASSSILSETGSQVWINKHDCAWNITRSAYDECIAKKVSLIINIKWAEDHEELATFSLELPCVEDTIDYNNIKEVVVNDYHFSYLFFVQPNYAISDDYYEQQVDEIYILSSSQDDPSLNDSDYQMVIEIQSIDHWTKLEEFLSANQLSSDYYTLQVAFNRSYQTLPITSFEGLTSLLTLKPMRFHGSISHIASYLSSVESPSIELCDVNGASLCHFVVDFEQFGLLLSRCPNDHCIVEGHETVQLNDTVRVHHMIDYSLLCPVLLNSRLINTVSLRLQISIRKVPSVLKHECTSTMKDHDVEVEILNMKLKNLEEYQNDTVKFYEKELDNRRRVISQLTQANRELETLCISRTSNTSSSYEMECLRNENEQLRGRIEDLKSSITQLQKEKDEMREIMVRLCNNDKELHVCFEKTRSHMIWRVSLYYSIIWKMRYRNFCLEIVANSHINRNRLIIITYRENRWAITS